MCVYKVEQGVTLLEEAWEQKMNERISQLNEKRSLIPWGAKVPCSKINSVLHFYDF